MRTTDFGTHGDCYDEDECYLQVDARGLLGACLEVDKDEHADAKHEEHGDKHEDDSHGEKTDHKEGGEEDVFVFSSFRGFIHCPYCALDEERTAGGHELVSSFVAGDA